MAGLLMSPPLPAGAVALAVLICNADQISDVIFGNEGAFKGFMELLHTITNIFSLVGLFQIMFTHFLEICRNPKRHSIHSPFNHFAIIYPEAGEVFHW